MKNKNVIIASLAMKGTEIASELSSFGLHAVTRADISGKIPRDTDAVVIDNTTGELSETVKKVAENLGMESRVFVLTNEGESMIFEENGILFISSKIDAKSVSEIVRFCTNSNRDIENCIKKMLFNLGFFAHFRGFRYIVDAIKIVLENPDAIYSVTKTVYPVIAEKHGRGLASIERSIRNAVETAYDNDKEGRFADFLGYMTQKPSNAEFISCCVERILMNFS